MALKSILNNKIRSLLTMLGIIIGVASVIAIVASIQGTTKLQRLQYEAMGANRIDVYAWGAKNKDWKDFEEYTDEDGNVTYGFKDKTGRTARTTAIFRCISSTNTTAR